MGARIMLSPFRPRTGWESRVRCDSGHRHVDYHRPDDPTSQRQPHRGGAHSDPSVTAASGSISLTPQVPSGVMTIIDGALSVRVRPDFSQVINYTVGVSLLLVSMVEP